MEESDEDGLGRREEGGRRRERERRYNPSVSYFDGFWKNSRQNLGSFYQNRCKYGSTRLCNIFCGAENRINKLENQHLNSILIPI